MDADRNMVAAPVETTTGFQAGSPEPLFAIGTDVVVIDISLPYDVSNDDERFVMAEIRRGGLDDESDAPDVILVQNFFEELRTRVPN